MLSRLFLPSLAAFVFTTAVSAQDRRGDNPDAPASPPREQLARFKVPPGFEVQLVAAEPQIQKPLNITFDAAGRLWVTGSEMYPWPARVDALGQPIPGFDKANAEIATAFRAGDKAPPAPVAARDSVRILSDFGPDGVARKIEVFADGLNIPSGVQPLPRAPGAKGDTAIVYSIPNIWRLEDTDGDGKADKREVLYGPFGYLDTHGGSSSYLYWIDGWIYGTHGFRNRSEVRDRKGKVTVLDSGNTYRFRPDGSAFEVYTHGQMNPFGLTVDPLGNFYSADSHSKPVYMLLRGGYYEGIGKQHDGLGFAPRITDDDHGSSAIAGIVYYAADQFPEEFRGNLFNGNPVTQKINRDRLEWHGSSPKAIRQPDFLSCDDPWFRPVQVKLGPDGALYIADFYNPIIGHYEVPLTDPRRDQAHGRIWRVVWRGDNKEAPAALPDLTRMTEPELLEKLAATNLEVRRMATNELVERCRKNPEAIAELGTFSKNPAAAKGHAPVHARALRERVAANPQENAAAALGSLVPGTGKEDADITAFLLRFHAGRAVADIYLTAMLARPEASVRRAAAERICTNPDPRLIRPLLDLLGATDAQDAQLIYTVRLALKACLAATGAFGETGPLAQGNASHAQALADIALAVKTPEASEFLLAHLERTKLETPRAGEYLKDALLYLPDAKLESVLRLLGSATAAPPAQKLALAASLEAAARERGFGLPTDIAAWSREVILGALGSDKEALVKPAIAAVREVKLEAKLEPLAAIVRQDSRDGNLRLAALEAAANLPASRELLVATFGGAPHMILRKRAAELLAQNGHTDVVLAALPNVPGELAISISGALARTDEGAAALLALMDAGKTSPRLLMNRAVSGPLAARPKALRDRAASLTKDLPPEDARLNGLITERAAGYEKTKHNAIRGAQVFQQTCAACHRFRNAGGNVGPNLDGVIARGPARLIEDILDPNRNVDPLFRQTTIETVDGETLLGGNPRDQGNTLLLSDLTGKDITVQKARIKKQTVSPLSLMPPVYEAAIAPADLYDLLAYLLSPSPAP